MRSAVRVIILLVFSTIAMLTSLITLFPSLSANDVFPNSARKSHERALTISSPQEVQHDIIHPQPSPLLASSTPSLAQVVFPEGESDVTRPSLSSDPSVTDTKSTTLQTRRWISGRNGTDKENNASVKGQSGESHRRRLLMVAVTIRAQQPTDVCRLLLELALAVELVVAASSTIVSPDHHSCRLSYIVVLPKELEHAFHLSLPAGDGSKAGNAQSGNNVSFRRPPHINMMYLDAVAAPVTIVASLRQYLLHRASDDNAPQALPASSPALWVRVVHKTTAVQRHNRPPPPRIDDEHAAAVESFQQLSQTLINKLVQKKVHRFVLRTANKTVSASEEDEEVMSLQFEFQPTIWKAFPEYSPSPTGGSSSSWTTQPSSPLRVAREFLSKIRFSRDIKNAVAKTMKRLSSRMQTQRRHLIGPMKSSSSFAQHENQTTRANNSSPTTSRLVFLHLPFDPSIYFLNRKRPPLSTMALMPSSCQEGNHTREEQKNSSLLQWLLSSASTRHSSSAATSTLFYLAVPPQLDPLLRSLVWRWANDSSSSEGASQFFQTKDMLFPTGKGPRFRPVLLPMKSDAVAVDALVDMGVALQIAQHNNGNDHDRGVLLARFDPTVAIIGARLRKSNIAEPSGSCRKISLYDLNRCNGTPYLVTDAHSSLSAHPITGCKRSPRLQRFITSVPMKHGYGLTNQLLAVAALCAWARQDGRRRIVLPRQQASPFAPTTKLNGEKAGVEMPTTTTSLDGIVDFRLSTFADGVEFVVPRNLDSPRNSSNNNNSCGLQDEEEMLWHQLRSYKPLKLPSNPKDRIMAMQVPDALFQKYRAQMQQYVNDYFVSTPDMYQRWPWSAANAFDRDVRHVKPFSFVDFICGCRFHAEASVAAKLRLFFPHHREPQYVSVHLRLEPQDSADMHRARPSGLQLFTFLGNVVTDIARYHSTSSIFLATGSLADDHIDAVRWLLMGCSEETVRRALEEEAEQKKEMSVNKADQSSNQSHRSSWDDCNKKSGPGFKLLTKHGWLHPDPTTTAIAALRFKGAAVDPRIIVPTAAAEAATDLMFTDRSTAAILTAYSSFTASVYGRRCGCPTTSKRSSSKPIRTTYLYDIGSNGTMSFAQGYPCGRSLGEYIFATEEDKKKKAPNAATMMMGDASASTDPLSVFRMQFDASNPLFQLSQNNHQ